MFCVNCGKSLVRGYQFCIECGTPVEDMGEPGEGAEGTPEGAETVPETEGGSLVFCPNCGMHMQTSTAFCETCGMRLSGEESAPSQPQQNYRPAVPLWNEDPLGGDLSGMSDQDIDRINNFVNGVSDFGVSEEEAALDSVEENLGGGADLGYSNYQPDYADLGASGNIPGATPEEIDALTAQLAQYSASAGAIPTVSAPTQQSVVSMQEEIAGGEGIRMNNFSMDAAEDEEPSVTDGVPIISGGSMDEDPNDTAPINPYGFLDNDFGDIDTAAAPAAVSAPVVEDIAPTVESITPAFEDIAPTVESITPAFEDIAPTVESIAPAFEDITPTVESIRPLAEDIMPTVDYSAAGGIAPTADTAPTGYTAPTVEEISPAVESAVPVIEDIAPPVEEIAPAAEEKISEEAPAVPESVSAPTEEPDDDFMDYGEPYIEEGLPVIAEYTEQPEPAENTPEPVAEAPVMDVPAPAAEVPELNRPGNAGRKITYCHNCGQDMFEDEEFCKNCNAPRNVALVPASQRKSKKLVPIIAAAAVVVAGAVVTVFVLNSRDAGNVVDDNTLSVSEPVGDPVGNNAADPINTVEADPAGETAENNAESKEENLFPPAPETSSDSAPQTSDTEKSTKPGSKPSTTPKSSAATPKATTPKATTPKPATAPKPSTTPSTPSPQTTAPKPATTPSKPSTSATTPKPSGSTTLSSSKVTSLEKDRKAITDAVAVIAGEVGKIEALAQNVVYAMENSSSGETARTAFYSRDFAKNMLSSIDSGKTAVDNAVSAAEPKNSEFDSAYDSLVTLQSKYEAYYKFIKSPSGNTSKFSSSCGTYLSGVTSCINSNFKYSSLAASSYNSNDTSLMYKAILSDAVAAANSAVSGFSSVEGSISGLDGSSFDTAVVKELSKSAVSKNYANAAANAQKVAGYVTILSGAPSEYSTAYSSLKTASSELTSLVDLLVMIQENTLDTYTESSQYGISSAKSAINKVKNAI